MLSSDGPPSRKLPGMPAAASNAASNPLVRKLENYTRLSSDDRAAVLRLWGEQVRRYHSKEDIVQEGEAPRVVRIVIDGWACRYKYLEDGRRQVLGLFVPGDFSDLNVFVLGEMDHFIGALTPVAIAQVSREVMEEVMLAQPRLHQALWWDALVNVAIQREWLLNLGSRDAYERITHLMVETFLRLRAAGRTQGLTCEWPLTQSTLADITGLSTVHVSRTFQTIREAGFVEVRDRTLRIRDLDALMRACQFSPGYLHLDREGRHLDANEAGEGPG